jgi:hypothetical protein
MFVAHSLPSPFSHATSLPHFTPSTPQEREAWVYSQLNIPLNSHTRTLAEHDGRFNMLRPLLAHMRDTQQGLGVVAVSPRYAIR